MSALTQNPGGAGYTRRTKPRAQVARGDAWVHPSNLAAAYKVDPDELSTVKDGMICHVSETGVKKGCPKGQHPYMAVCDATDTDAVSADAVLLVDLLGPYTILTGYFDEDVSSYPKDSVLIAATGGKAGRITIGTGYDDATVDILGVVEANVVDLGVGFPKRDNTATDPRMLKFVTNYVPSRT